MDRAKEKEFLNQREAASYLKMSYTTFGRKHLEMGLPPFQLYDGPHGRRWLKSNLDAYLRSCMRQVEAKQSRDRRLSRNPIPIGDRGAAGRAALKACGY